jgi:hypothetical protein
MREKLLQELLQVIAELLHPILSKSAITPLFGDRLPMKNSPKKLLQPPPQKRGLLQELLQGLLHALAGFVASSWRLRVRVKNTVALLMRT